MGTSMMKTKILLCVVVLMFLPKCPKASEWAKEINRHRSWRIPSLKRSYPIETADLRDIFQHVDIDSSLIHTNCFVELLRQLVLIQGKEMRKLNINGRRNAVEISLKSGDENGTGLYVIIYGIPMGTQVTLTSSNSSVLITKYVSVFHENCRYFYVDREELEDLGYTNYPVLLLEFPESTHPDEVEVGLVL